MADWRGKKREREEKEAFTCHWKFEQRFVQPVVHCEQQILTTDDQYDSRVEKELHADNKMCAYDLWTPCKLGLIICHYSRNLCNTYWDYKLKYLWA